MRRLILLVVLATLSLAWMTLPTGGATATCDDHATQAEAQAAADTDDGDGDGIYCETLPCPCGDSPARPPLDEQAAEASTCQRPRGVQSISFSATKYPNIRAHFQEAVAAGWGRVLVVNRSLADARRDRLLSGFPTREAFDRDEYPPAAARGRGRGLERGRNPRGWKASVAYVPSSENRSHGATLGIKMRRFCDGTRIRYVFY